MLTVNQDPGILSHSGKTVISGPIAGCMRDPVSRYKVLWIGKIAKHKDIGETKVLRRKKKAKVLWIYWLP